MIELEIAEEAPGWSALGEAEATIRRAIEAALSVAPDAPSSVAVSVLLADDDAIRELNRSWRGKDKATNVLSFPAPAMPGAPGPRHLGDIALAYETVLREAEAEDKTFHDHATHLLVHGTLHLLGYDHELEADAEIMESLEVEALHALGIANPYHDKAA